MQDGLLGNVVNIDVPFEPSVKQKVCLEEQYREAAKSFPVLQQPIASMPNVSSTFGVDPIEFSNQFKNIDNMSDEELFNLVLNTFDIVFMYTKQKDPISMGVVWSLVNNPKYITMLVQVLGQIQLNFEQILCANRIIYDYINLQDSNAPKNKLVEISINGLANIVNKCYLAGISDLPLTNDEATMIAMCSHSSANNLINVKRLNLYMINTGDDQKYNVFTIVKIYQEYFYYCVTQLLEGIMFDSWSQEELNTLTQNQQNIYYTINEAILCILEQAPTNIIYTVLKSYCNDYYHNSNGVHRFSMILSADYPRINSVIAQLETESIYLP